MPAIDRSNDDCIVYTCRRLIDLTTIDCRCADLGRALPSRLLLELGACAAAGALWGGVGE